MTVRHVLPVLCLGIALGAPAQNAPKSVKSSELLFPEGYLPLTDADKSLTSVPFAPGAPAVVIVDGLMQQLSGSSVVVRRVRRVKILTEAGRQYGDHAEHLRGEWNNLKVHARTILPDGTEIDAKDDVHVKTEKDPDLTDVTVTFPRVAPGAILDFAMSATVSFIRAGEWTPQERIPVLESRYVIEPRTGMHYRTGYMRLDPKDVEMSFAQLGPDKIFGWTVRNVEPLPMLPNMPAFGDVAKELVIIPDSYTSSGGDRGMVERGSDYGGGDAGALTFVPLATDWKSFSRERAHSWDDYLKGKHAKCDALAATTAAAATTPRDKAEAVRKALRERVTAWFDGEWPTARTPDASLEQAHGSSGDVAGVMAAMLRSLDVPVHLAAYRRRDSGTLPTQFPAPDLLDDVLVVIEGAGPDGKDLFVAPSFDVPVGKLPLDARGVNVVPYTKASEGPTWLPDETADHCGIDRDVRLELALDGTINGEAMVTATGSSASEWRNELKLKSAEDRKLAIEHELQRYMPSAQLTAHAIDGLDDPQADLVVTAKWEAANAAQRAGGRMLVNPFVFERVDTRDWGAETRDYDVWLGRPYHHHDRVEIVLPQGIASVQLPGASKLEAGDTGGYVTSYEGKDRSLIATRTVRFEQTLFPAKSWTPLRSWFQDMAKADDQAIVLTLAEGP